MRKHLISKKKLKKYFIIYMITIIIYLIIKEPLQY
jgi:hypothetical protein